jgi:hypothetical protein
MSETLRLCPFCGGKARLIQGFVRCDTCNADGPWGVTRKEAIAAWNTRSESDGERVREAEDRGYKRAAKMIAALVADAMIYEDSYGVVGSEFPCCMACNAGGAPGINFTHQANCVVLKCETIADDLWQEQRDELNDAARETAITEAIQALIDASDYFDNRADVNDGDYGEPSPNREMTLASQCDEALERLEALRARAQMEGGK